MTARDARTLAGIVLAAVLMVGTVDAGPAVRPAALSSPTASAQKDAASGEETPAPVRIENRYVTYLVGAEGTNRAFRDRASGRDYLAEKRPGRFLTVKVAGKSRVPASCRQEGEAVIVRFLDPEVVVRVQVFRRRHYVVFEVASVTGAAVESMSLLNLRVTTGRYVSGMSGVAAGEDFAAAVRALNLQVNPSVGGRPPRLVARCTRRYRFEGARVALAGCPAAQVRPVLKEVLRTEDVLHSPLGGPFALDADVNRGSYVFARVSEDNVDDWIALCRRAGIVQLHFHGWWQSLGHYVPRKNLFPHGLEGLKAAVEKVHAAGLKAGMHTLTGCISTNDPYVTPVPDPRLGADATFTLAAPLDAKGVVVRTTGPPPASFDTVWAYGGRGNALRIGKEIIRYAGLAREEPFGFTGCTRGAFGTRASAHPEGAEVAHLWARYNCFQPGEDSDLVGEVARRIADVYNTCGFDMIYMDGAEGMHGGWHGMARMRAAIFRRLRRPCLVEASAWGHHSWPFHSRIGAWDHPKWGLKRFIDRHCEANRRYRAASLLPAQLGWWAILGPAGQWDAERRDEVEYLCAKALGHDMPLSFQTVRATGDPPNARQNEYLDLVGRYERLRLTGKVPEAVREHLREERAEFRLLDAEDERPRFVPVDCTEHKVTGLEDGSAKWTVANRFGKQRPEIRIQALWSLEPYDTDSAVTLARMTGDGAFTKRGSAEGVENPALVPNPGPPGSGGSLRTANKRTERRGAWARLGKTFDPHADLTKHGGVGVWVHGDGKGEVLNVQLTNPPQYYRALSEHYVTVDFEGWRYVELLFRERDADRYADYLWPYAGHYNVYRGALVRGHVNALNLYVNEVPPGEAVRIGLRRIRALPARKVTLRNPGLAVGDRRMTFPVALDSSGAIEYRPGQKAVLYDARGAVVREFSPRGRPPELVAGSNTVTFNCESPEGYRARAHVMIVTAGEPVP